MQKIYPFKFLDSYQREDKDFFFGRTEEIETLYQMIFQTRILLIYGTSGTGKTSLIQCGLANKFQSYDWLALYIRRGGNLISSLDKALCDESDGVFTYDGQSEHIIHNLPEKLESVYKASFKPIYLIFDQFEELYVLGAKTEQEQFIKTVKEILATDQPVKIILSMREEYLGYLYGLEKEIPQIMRKTLRVEPMMLDKVTDVIRGINNFKHSLVKIKTDEIEAITQEIFERLKGKEKTLTIQLPYLQVFLDKLYINKTNDHDHQTEAEITLEDLKKIGDIEDVLQNFLEEQVREISQELSTAKTVVKTETIWKILSNFCTLEGTKEPISKKEVAERLKPDIVKKLVDQSVDAFAKNRILKKSEIEDLYELTHDALALKIAEKRSEDDISMLEVKRLIKSQTALKAEYREDLSEKQLNFIEPYLAKIAPELNEEEKNYIEESIETLAKQKRALARVERRKRMKRRMWVYMVFVLMLVAIGILAIRGNRNLAKYKLLSDVGRIDVVLTSANSNLVRVNDISEKDPTLALQLDRLALVLLDSARRMDTLRDESYFMNAKLKEAEYRKLDSLYHVTDSLVRKQANGLLDKDFALYRKVQPENIADTIFDIRFVNDILPDRNDDGSFRLWHGGKEIKDSILNNPRVAQVVFPLDNNAMVLIPGPDCQLPGRQGLLR